MATTNTATTVAFVLALIGGLIVLVTSILTLFGLAIGRSSFGGYGSYMRGVMDGYHRFHGQQRRLYRLLSKPLNYRCSLRCNGGDECHHSESQSPATRSLGSRNHCVFSDKFRGHGRLLHRRDRRHHRWSFRFKLKAKYLMNCRPGFIFQKAFRCSFCVHASCFFLQE